MFRRMPRWLVGLSAAGTLIGGGLLLKDYFHGGLYPGDEKLFGKTVIITGATSGLGRETALELAKRGGRIIMACRDLATCEPVKDKIVEASFNQNVECKLCNLASIKSIREFASEVNTNEKRVDILINNAAQLGPTRPRTLTENGFEVQLGINYLGHFLLTNLLLDKLKSSGLQNNPSRIINVVTFTRDRQKLRFHDLNWEEEFYWYEAFLHSKLALKVFSEELSRRLTGSPVCVFGVYPPLSKTNISRHTKFNKGLSGITMAPLMNLFIASAKYGAQTHIYCALNPDIINESGKYFMKQDVMQSAECLYKEKHIPGLLWEISEYWTQLRDYPQQSEQTNASIKNIPDKLSKPVDKSTDLQPVPS